MEGEIAGQQASDAEVVLQEFECDSGMMSMWQTHGYIYNDGVGQHQDGIVIDVGCRMPKAIVMSKNRTEQDAYHRQ